MTVPNTEGRGLGLEQDDLYTQFRADLAGDPTDVAACAYYFALKDLTSLADDTEGQLPNIATDGEAQAVLRSNRARVRRIFAEAVADAKSMTPENRVFMVSMIAADVTG